MAALLLGTAPVLVARITQAREGVWVAYVEATTETSPSGRVTLTPETGAPWHGTVVTGGLHGGTWRGRVVGGGGGLRSLLPATSYRDATLQDVLADAVREAGETLAAGVDLSSWVCRLYVRAARSAARTVADVAAAASVSWRVTRAGSVWVGAEAWPRVELPEVSVVEEDPAERRYSLSGATLGLDPGVSVSLPLEGGATTVRVDSVLHRVDEDGVTASVWVS